MKVQRSKLPKFSWRAKASIGTVLVLITVGLIAASVLQQDRNKVIAETYKEQLRSQVDASNGSPQNGRDPASQTQTSLASAASKPTNSRQQQTDQTSSDATPAGLGANGCFIDYGIQGQECLPAHAATNGVLTCDGVRAHFPNGIKVTGTDRYHLDHNHDGIACNSGD